MALTIGTRLGPYEILGAAGAGGMGEVYRARDTRLERTVAIKMLPEFLANSPSAQQRLDREARAVSSLSHPNICQLYDIGHQEGVNYLVLEFVEGETLHDRLARGRLPVEQVLKLGVEIADALEKAHAKSIVHRDLKPSNIMLTKGGAKLLDFGLAKPLASGIDSVLTAMTKDHPLTAEGTIVGTFHYMAPEQVEGHDADARSDIFALGAVLYEAATGTRAFDGRTQATVIAAVLERDPAPISAVQPMSPPVLDRVVQTCLKKDPDERFQTAHDLKLQLQWIADGVMGSGTHTGARAADAPPVALSSRVRGERVAWIVAALLLVAALGFAWVALRRQAPASSAVVMRFEVAAPQGRQFADAAHGGVEVSPDGEELVFAAEAAGKTKLWVRPLDSLDARELPGTDGAMYPFWSPDSKSVGFFVGNKLRRVPVGGGDPETVATVTAPMGGAWSSKGLMLVGSETDGIYKVADTGGMPEKVVAADAAQGFSTLRWPSLLPDEDHFVYECGNGKAEQNKVCVAALSDRKPKALLAADSNARYASGYLFYFHEGALHAHPFDAGKLALTGPPIHAVERVNYDRNGSRALFSVTDAMIAYQQGTGAAEDEVDPAKAPGDPRLPVAVVTEWKKLITTMKAD